jgi:hypothetical protein
MLIPLEFQISQLQLEPVKGTHEWGAWVSSNQLRSIDVYNTTNYSLLKAKTIYNHPLTKAYKVHFPFSICLTNFKENIPHNLEKNHTVKCCPRVYCQHSLQAPCRFQMLSMEEISKSMGSQLQQRLSQTQMKWSLLRVVYCNSTITWCLIFWKRSGKIVCPFW